MKKLIRLNAALLALTLAASSFAFVEQRPPGAKFAPEQSQEQVTQQQALSGQYGVLGDEDLVQPKPDVKMLDADAKAADVLIESSPAATSMANRALVKAEQDVANAPKPRTMLAVWGVLFLVLGAGAVWVFKSYADKVVPDMPSTPKGKTKW